MKFSGRQDKLQWEFESEIHPDLRTLILETDSFCRNSSMPGITCIELVRTVDEQVDKYASHWEKLIARFSEGQWLGPEDSKTSVELLGLSRGELEDVASRRPSWHLFKCAADIDTSEFTPSQMKSVTEFVYAKTKDTRKWRVSIHDTTSTAMHFEVRAFDYRAKFDPRKKSEDRL